MPRIEIKTQAEFDALPPKFDVWTCIEIRSARRIVVTVARENSSVVARENSSVEAYGNSSVVARENSSVVAYGNSSVEAYGNSSVVARENSSVEAYGNSSVVAYGNSSVVAYGNSSVVARENSSVVARENSSVEAYGNSSVVARENSSVVAYGNSSVVARENSSVVAYGNSSVVARENSSVVAYGNSSVEAAHYSMVTILTAFVVLKALRDFAICRLMPDAHKVKPKKKAKGATLIKSPATPEKKHTQKSFLAEFGLEPDEKGFITLYKSVNPKTGCDFKTGKIKYSGEVIAPDWNPDKSIQCGEGLHLSPTRGNALSYNIGRIIECRVHVDDFVVYATDITKVRCRRVFAPEVTP